MSDTYDERLLRQFQLEMALEVKRICDSHGLAVFLAYGSLLGAVRHKGFIPWDDDMDLAMLRRDYDAFVQLCDTELGSKWYLQTIESEPGFGQGFAKVRAHGTRFVHRDSTKVAMRQGVYIDIFPLDNAPNGRFARWIQAAINWSVRRELVRRAGYGLSPRGERIARVIRVPMLVVPTRLITRLLMSNATRFLTYDTASVVSLFGGYPYEREALRREWLADRMLMEFEGVDYWVPARYDEVLKQLYGDYMTPPPPYRRTSHHDPEIVDLGQQPPVA